MAGMLRSEATRHGISIHTDLEDDLPMTVADRVQLQQVLMNLMLNGIEAMSDKRWCAYGQITIRGRRQDPHLCERHGPGLRPGKADQLFDGVFTTKPQGSGMGLSISKSIVEHSGRIWTQ